MSVTYEERNNQRNSLISLIKESKISINISKGKIKVYEEEIKRLNEEIEEKYKKMNEKIENLKKKAMPGIVKLEEEREKLEKENGNENCNKDFLINTLKKLENIYEKCAIPVPEKGGYEIKNGLEGMKREINLKLTKYLDITKIRSVL
jgi:Skp family chaperone for outer membrane proteins